jgi:hypothetical protein
MGTRSTFLGLPMVTAAGRRPTLPDWSGGQGRPGNSLGAQTVPETDTGGLVEHTQAFERTVLKELGKLPP